MANATRSRGRPRKHLPIPCAQCGETFQPKSKSKDRPPQQYCSLSCASKANNNRNRNRPSPTPEQKLASKRAKDRRRRMRKRTATYDGVTDQEIFERDRWMCRVDQCVFGSRRINPKRTWPDPRAASVDHILPIALGGDDTSFNKRASHLRCNMTRQTGGPGEQLPLGITALAAGERLKPPRKPRPCKICGELRDAGAICSLHEPVFYAECRACSAPILKRWRVKTGRLYVCQACSRCAASGCMASGSFGQGYCAPHYHRLKRYGDVFSDIPLAKDRLGRLEVTRLIQLRVA